MKKQSASVQPANGSPIVFNKKNLTFAQRSADIVTKFLGSWTFILLFIFILLSWIAANLLALIYHWDPYPFILLNLVLSCVAALQAPIIMMSQNRQTQRDRLVSQYDYAVNRKAEREIQEIQKILKAIRQDISKKK